MESCSVLPTVRSTPASSQSMSTFQLPVYAVICHPAMLDASPLSHPSLPQLDVVSGSAVPQLLCCVLEILTRPSMGYIGLAYSSAASLKSGEEEWCSGWSHVSQSLMYSGRSRMVS